MIKGVLFDMDGVLVDSEEYICQAAIMMFKEKGLTVKPDDFKDFVGKGENRYIGGVAEKYNFPLNIEKLKARTYEIYGEITKGKLEPLAGVHEFIAKCKDKRLKIALATSADRVKIFINLESIGLDENNFDGTVNGLEVKRKKPYPDIFIQAANKIGIATKNCLVVEDAVSGVEAAKAAGCKCLGLTTSFTADELYKADWTAANLAVAPDKVLNW
jgi:HAD superfamily hydrolase (TIGR01509 family)